MIYDIKPQLKSDPIQYLEFPSYVVVQSQLFEKAQMTSTNYIVDTTINVPIEYVNTPYHLSNTLLNIIGNGYYIENACFYDRSIPHIQYAIHAFGNDYNYVALFRLNTEKERPVLTTCSLYVGLVVNNIKELYQNESIILFALEILASSGLRFLIYNKKTNVLALHADLFNYGNSVTKLYEQSYFSHILFNYTNGKMSLVELDTTVAEDGITVLENHAVIHATKYIPNNILHWKNNEYLDVSINNTGITFYKIVVADEFKSFTSTVIENNLTLTAVANGSHNIKLTKHTINNKDYVVMSIYKSSNGNNSVSEINSGLYLFRYDTKLTLLHHWSLVDNMPVGILRVSENNIFYWIDNKHKFSILRINQTLLQFIEVYSSYEEDLFILSSDMSNTTYAQYMDYSIDLIPKRGKHRWVINWDRDLIKIAERDGDVNLIVDCFDSNGKRIKDVITLELITLEPSDAIFKSNNTKLLTIESSEQNSVIIPVYIINHGIIKIKRVV